MYRDPKQRMGTDRQIRTAAERYLTAKRVYESAERNLSHAAAVLEAHAIERIRAKTGDADFEPPDASEREIRIVCGSIVVLILPDDRRPAVDVDEGERNAGARRDG